MRRAAREERRQIVIRDERADNSFAMGGRKAVRGMGGRREEELDGQRRRETWECLELTNGAWGQDIQQMSFLHSAATHLV